MLAITQIKARNLAKPFSPEAAESEAQKAIAVDPDEPSALAALAWVAFCRGDHESIVNHAERGITVDPNYAGAYLAKAAGLVYSGRASEGREAATIALRLNPRDPMGATIRLILLAAYYFERNYSEALAVCRSAIRDYPDFVLQYRWEAASLGQLGRTEEANRALRRAITLSSAAFDFYARNRQPWWRAEEHEHMLEGLRKAGWQC
jgi:adenylate cyclase